MKIIFFNGPPRSGKDTAALRAIKWCDKRFINSSFERFAMPCKTAFAAVAGSLVESIDEYGNVSPFEETKTNPIPWLDNASYRQFQIDFSEKFMKPLYGSDIFGQLLINRIQNCKDDVIVIPDSGFVEEVGPVARHFGIENVILVRVHREGFDFTGDSRSYLKNVVPIEVDIRNNDSKTTFEENVDKLLEQLLLSDKNSFFEPLNEEQERIRLEMFRGSVDPEFIFPVAGVDLE